MSDDKNLKFWIEDAVSVLGYYQVIGGALGLATGLLAFIVDFPDIGTASILTLAILLIGYLFSIYCGRKVLKKEKNGLEYSLVNQLLQVIGFSIAGFTYQYVAGPAVYLTLDFTERFNFIVNLGIFSNLNIGLNTKNAEVIAVSVNFIALYLVYLIDKIQDKIAAHQEMVNRMKGKDS